MADARVTGGEQFYRLAKSLREAGNKELARELTKNMRTAAKPLIARTRAQAKADLPKRGGLADQVAREPQRAQVRGTGLKSQQGVSIVVGRRRGGARAADAGLIRHPVFGRDVWTEQPVKPGWFSGTLQSVGPDIARPFIEEAMQAVINKIVREAG